MNNWNKRDWINFSIIIALIQGIIWGTSFVFSDHPSALGYTSFAGTLISIILAVLAIGYTYGESIKQKNNSDTVVNQITTLNDVIKSIKIEASQLEKISEISKELTHLSEIFNDGMHNTHQKFDSLNQSVNKLIEDNIKEVGNKEYIPNTIDKGLLLKLLLNSKNALLENGLLLIYLIKKEKSENFLVNIVEKSLGYEKALAQKFPDQKNISIILNMFAGSNFSIVTMFKGVELIKEEREDGKRILILDPILETKIEGFVKKDKKLENPFQAGLRELILQDIHLAYNFDEIK